MPARVTIRRGPDGVEIVLRWLCWAVLLLVPFCIFWNSWLVSFFSAASRMNAPWFVKLFPLIHVAAGALITYFTLATILNSTQIRVGGGRMVIRHGPLPWPGNRSMPASEINQVYYKVRTRNDADGETVHREVWMERTDGTHLKLLGAGITSEQALFIEQEIERALGIEDRPVDGEAR